VAADWDSFDSHAYVSQNYGHGILPEDMRIMRFVVAELRNMNIAPNSFRATADIGAGPNLYPGLLLAPYVAPSGSLDLVDRSAANLRYLDDAMTNGAPDVWLEFERDLRRLGHPTSIRKLRDVAAVRQGSIYDLPAGQYDAVMCFFVAESITDDPEEFATAVDVLMRSLKPSGLFVTAHMVGSTGYGMGPDTQYPACDLTMPEIETVYQPYGTFRSVLATHDSQRAARPGYHGMAALVGRRSA
jgi:hypothetical protein